jgi:hypothetical protein
MREGTRRELLIAGVSIHNFATKNMLSKLRDVGCERLCNPGPTQTVTLAHSSVALRAMRMSRRVRRGLSPRLLLPALE